MSDERSGVFKFRFNALSSTVNEKGEDKKTLRRLLVSLSPYKKRLGLFFAISILYSISYVAFPRLLGSILDLFSDEVISYLLGVGDGSVFRKMLPYAVIAIAVFFFNALLGFLQGHIISSVVTDYAFSLRSAVTDKFNRLTVRYIDSTDHRETVMKMTGDVDALNQSLNIVFMKHISALLLTVCITIMQFVLSPVLGAFSLVFCALAGLVSFVGRKKEKKNAEKQQSTTFYLFDGASEFFSGLATLQLSGRIDEITDSLSNLNEETAELTDFSRKSDSRKKGTDALIGGLCLVFVAVAGAFLTGESLITVGILQCQLIYVRKLFSSFSELSLVSGVKRTLISSAASLFEFFDVAETEDKEEKLPLPREKEGTIDFCDVTFSYEKGGRDVLKNVSFSLPQRGITRLSGVTGAGKTTIIKLMLGFYPPDSGKVLYKGEEVHRLDQREYLSLFNVIVQGAGLFGDTIYNNVIYGSEHVSDEQLRKAAELTGADELIKKLPQGYNTVFNTAEPNLSEGEIQLVLLTRAFLRKREIVIFDEATSGIDIITEKRINKALELLSEECSVIIISHRSSVIGGVKNRILITDGKTEQT